MSSSAQYTQSANRSALSYSPQRAGLASANEETNQSGSSRLTNFSLAQPPKEFHNPTLDQVLISASYGHAITNTTLKLFPYRLNVHPSLIPKYRGASPIQTAIANGDDVTGVSVINMEEVGLGFDVGDVHAITSMVREISSAPGGWLCLVTLCRTRSVYLHARRTPAWPRFWQEGAENSSWTF
jgi:methionyl-tRNA formyltransferase